MRQTSATLNALHLRLERLSQNLPFVDLASSEGDSVAWRAIPVAASWIMPMKPVSRSRLRPLTVAALFLCSSCLAQTKTSPDSFSLLREMYLATGGNGWSGVPGAEASGSYDMGGLKGTFHQVIDLQNGRDVLTYDVGTTRGQQGTEQTASWWMDEKGLVTVQEAPEALADAATQSYEDRNGWFHPDSNVHPRYLGSRQENGRSFYQVQVQPPAGRSLTLWIDSDTHRLDRVVWLDSHQRENTTVFSDYRQVNRIWYPFVQRSSTGDPDSDVTMTITKLRVRPELTEHDFAPPLSTTHDARLLRGESSTIPFLLKDGMIVVNVSVDGKPPLPFVLDSGALNVLTPEAAKSLQVAMQGDLSANGVGNGQVNAHLAHIKTYQVGSAELSDQSFIILPLPRAFTDNGKQEPVAGLIGYEFLRRFVVSIDYHHRELTVALPGKTGEAERGTRVPLLFDGRHCFIAASVDGAPGYFGIDTGDDGALTLFGSFFSAHHIPIETPGIEGFQGGVGGNASTLLTRVNSLSLGPFTVQRPLTELHFATGGAFAATRVAGNLGSQVFRNFIMTFDYEHRALYLKRSPDFGYAMPYNRTGVHLDINEAADILVTSVNKSSPGASAGVQAHDQVVAIDNRPVQGLPYSDIQDVLSRPAGKQLNLDVLRNGERKHFVITPRELLPPSANLQMHENSAQ